MRSIETTTVHTVGCCTITKWITGYAYARNGNAHNPTPRVRWMVTDQSRLVGGAATLREAKEIARDWTDNPEETR